MIGRLGDKSYDRVRGYMGDPLDMGGWIWIFPYILIWI